MKNPDPNGNYFKVKESWSEEASKVLNSWTIDYYKENNNKLEACGIIYSPTGDVNKPYPIHSWTFTLTWDKVFSMKFDFPFKHFNSFDLDSDFDLKKIFECRDSNVYFNFKDNDFNNVGNLLKHVYNTLYPDSNIINASITWGMFISHLCNSSPE